MLLKKETLHGIAAGRISVAFRRWKRPTVKAGGTLRTAIGVLSIESVEVIDEASITAADAKRAGYASRDALIRELDSREGSDLYRIALGYAGDDPRERLRQQDQLSSRDLQELAKRLAGLDRSSRHGPWTMKTLRLIAQFPARRAPELAEKCGLETMKFKTNVRKLKELGLTESLKVGYRLSPRGAAALKKLPARGP